MKLSPMPHLIEPMLSHLTDKPFDREGWFYEIKWDGYRAIAEIAKGKPLIYSRNLISFNERFPSVTNALKKIKDDVVLDGEIVILTKSGKSNFQSLQNYLTFGEADGALRYCVFDLLYHNGKDLRDFPLIERKKLLYEVIKKANTPILIYSDHIEMQGIKFFEIATKKGLEGIMAKDGQSQYIAGKRTYSWLKIKTHLRQEVVIAGFTAPRGGRKKFGSLIIGVYQGNKLKYVGHVGGGFTEKSLEEMHKKLIPLITEKSPFENKPKTNMPVTWVLPKLVGEVSFQEWTKEGIMRQPIFQGLRIDKSPKSVKRENSDI